MSTSRAKQQARIGRSAGPGESGEEAEEGKVEVMKSYGKDAERAETRSSRRARGPADQRAAGRRAIEWGVPFHETQALPGLR
jgi:hypothetical protein